MDTAGSRLPQELLKKIIDENNSDQPTLRSCALVCYAFLPSSQANIFSVIRLVGKKEGPNQHLHKVLVESPHLRTYVRTLNIELEEGGDHSCLAALLDFFPAVTSLCLVILTGSEWCNLPKELRIAICGFCHRSALVTLRLIHLGTVTEMTQFVQLLGSSALQKLFLRGITLVAPQDNAVPWGRHIGLTELELDLGLNTHHIVVNGLIEGKSLSRLCRLWVAWDAQKTSAVQKTLDASPSLEDLTLISYSFTPDHSNTLRLEKLCRLRILEVDITVDPRIAGGLAQMLAGLLQLSPKGLETFLLEFSLFADVPTINWDPVVNVLTTTTFPTLANVDIRVIYMERGIAGITEEPTDKFIQDIQLGLHHLHEQGILRCSCPHRVFAF
ncbi:hypothetical protein C8R47DRAFT_1084048 [Mycena vitilis]|nr:hypothetical protein C8R47DRAFT_1084048 [Mycena vitilis]